VRNTTRRRFFLHRALEVTAKSNGIMAPLIHAEYRRD